MQSTNANFVSAIAAYFDGKLGDTDTTIELLQSLEALFDLVVKSDYPSKYPRC